MLWQLMRLSKCLEEDALVKCDQYFWSECEVWQKMNRKHTITL